MMQTAVLPLQPMQMWLTHPPERHLKRCRPQSRALIPQPYLTPLRLLLFQRPTMRPRPPPVAYRCDSGNVAEQARSARRTTAEAAVAAATAELATATSDAELVAATEALAAAEAAAIASRAAEAEAIALLAGEGSGATNEEGRGNEATTTEVASGSVDRVVAQTAGADAKPIYAPDGDAFEPASATRDQTTAWVVDGLQRRLACLADMEIGARRRGSLCRTIAASRPCTSCARSKTGAPARSGLGISGRPSNVSGARWPRGRRQACRAAGSARGMRRLAGTIMPTLRQARRHGNFRAEETAVVMVAQSKNQTAR